MSSTHTNTTQTKYFQYLCGEKKYFSGLLLWHWQQRLLFLEENGLEVQTSASGAAAISRPDNLNRNNVMKVLSRQKAIHKI